MKPFHLLFALGIMGIIWSFSACTTQTIDPQFGILPQPFADTLAALGPVVEQHKIDPTKETIVKGKNGTRLFVAANSLLDANGKPVTTPVKLELKENFTMADFVLSNLQTLHNGEILQTQGMIYFSATTEDGSAVTIDPTKPIRIELPIDTTIADAKIFTGQREADGQINWNEINEPSKTLVPFPIASIIKQNGNDCWFWWWEYYDLYSEKDTAELLWWEESILWSWKEPPLFNQDSLVNYENSLIATREFAERFNVMCAPGLLSLYIENLDKNMWELDKLTIETLKKDSARYTSYYNNYWKELENLDPAAIELRIERDNAFWRNYIVTFQNFAAQKLTKVDPNRKVADTTIAQINAAYIAYDALEFGWVNVDYFYQDPLAENIKLSAQTNMDAHIVNLIFPKQNIILSGTRNGQNKYLFTKNQDGYNKLPRGEKAILLALGYEGEKLFFVKKEITIGERELETLDLKLTNGLDIQQELSALNNKPQKPIDEGEEGAL